METDVRSLAITLFNRTRTLLDQPTRTPAEDEQMLHGAHASRYHWGEAGTEVHLARGEWLCSRVYAALGRAEPCLHHAQRVVAICTSAGIGDWDLAFGHEAVARARAIAGEPEAARAEIEQALAVPVADAEDRDLLLQDLATIPGVERFW